MRNLYQSLLTMLQFLHRLKGVVSGKKVKTASWQSVFGWSISAAWLMLMASVCWIVISGRPDAVPIIMALVETVPLWGVALGVLAIAFMKGCSGKRTGLGRLKTKNITKRK